MHSSDLGPAMALSGAQSEGTRDALKVVIAAAETTVSAIKTGAGELADAYDRTAVLNIASALEFFVAEIRKSDWRLREAEPVVVTPQAVDLSEAGH